jgi:hypothetical protein
MAWPSGNLLPLWCHGALSLCWCRRSFAVCWCRRVVAISPAMLPMIIAPNAPMIQKTIAGVISLAAYVDSFSLVSLVSPYGPP